MQLIKGLFYEGSSTRPYKAEISLNTVCLKITFPNHTEKQDLKWEHSKIQTQDIPGSTKILLNYGVTHQSLEVDAEVFFEVLKNIHPGAHYMRWPKKSYLSKGMFWFLSVSGFFIGLAALLYFLAIPLAVNLVVSAIPIDSEIELGKRMAKNALESETVDTAKSLTINKFFNNIQINTQYPIHITVVKRDVKNAFAIPGGEIVVYTGLLNEMKNYSELVALLGHEIAHVEKRHTLKMLGKSLGLYLIVSSIFQDAGGITAVLVDNASALQRLSYNRNLEAQADEEGLETMLKNKVDPNGMIALFNHLKNDITENTEPEFLMTHPSLEKRIETLKHKLSEIPYQVVKNDSLELHWRNLKHQ